VRLVGGAEVSGAGASDRLRVGRRNILSAKNLLWKNGVFIRAEDVGGMLPRTVTLSVGEGRLQISTGGEPPVPL
jgi:chemotaxis protein CheD